MNSGDQGSGLTVAGQTHWSFDSALFQVRPFGRLLRFTVRGRSLKLPSGGEPGGAVRRAQPFKGMPDYRLVTGRPSHLANSSIKRDGVRVFLSGRDRPLSPGFPCTNEALIPNHSTLRSSRKAYSRERRFFQRSHPSRFQRKSHPQVATDLSGSTSRNLACLRSRKTGAKTCSRIDGDHLAASRL